MPILCSRRSPSSSAAPRGAFSCLTLYSGYSSLHGTFRSSIQPARPDAVPFRIIIYRPFFPPVPSRMKIVVCMFDFGCRCNRIGRSTLWQDQSPGQTNPPPRRIVLCPPDIPIERKSCLVIPRLQHVRSLTPRAAAAVSRTDRRLTCTGTYVV